MSDAWYEETHATPEFDPSKFSLSNPPEWTLKGTITNIVDSGERREFSTGAVRDIQEGKGRCDLLPLDVVAKLVSSDVLALLYKYIESDDEHYLKTAINNLCSKYFGDMFTAILEVSKHYEDGANKYGERNWEKGIPAHCFVDSAVRHFLKMMRGDTDERHDRACLWNLLGLWWTVKNMPEMNDLWRREQK